MSKKPRPVQLVAMNGLLLAQAALEIAKRINHDVQAALENRPQITSEHYQAALDLAGRIDTFLQPPSRRGSGGAHFCRRNGQILLYADQVIRAILEDDLADPVTEGRQTVAAGDIVYWLCECNSPNCTKLVGMTREEYGKITNQNYFIISAECAFGYEPWGVLVEKKEGYYIVKEKVI